MRTHWQTHAHTNTGKHLWYIYIHIVTRLYTHTLACMLCILHIAYRCVHICSCLKNELQMHTHWQTHTHLFLKTHVRTQELIYAFTHTILLCGNTYLKWLSTSIIEMELQSIILHQCDTCDLLILKTAQSGTCGTKIAFAPINNCMQVYTTIKYIAIHFYWILIAV
jgi:hypothetical protein